MRQPALDFKGMIVYHSQVFRPRGANLIAQEGGVSELFYKDRYRVCVFMWGSTEGELLPRVSTPQFVHVRIVLFEDKFYA